MPLFLRPTAPIAPDVILTGDPKRTMELAVDLVEAPRMANLARGLWGYSGTTGAGAELTVQSTGIGAASAAAVLADLAELGVERAIRIGTCEVPAPSLPLGSALVVEGADTAGPANPAFDSGDRIPDEPLTRALAANAGCASAWIRSVDPVEPRPAQGSRAAAYDLASAAVIGTGAWLGVRVACVLVVASNPDESLADEALDAAVRGLGPAAAATLAAAQAGSGVSAPASP